MGAILDLVRNHVLRRHGNPVGSEIGQEVVDKVLGWNDILATTSTIAEARGTLVESDVWKER